MNPATVFVQIAEATPSLALIVRNVEATGINLTDIINAAIDYESNFDIEVYIDTLGLQLSEEEKEHLIPFLQALIIGYLKYADIAANPEKFRPEEVLEAATWGLSMRKEELNDLKSKLPFFTNGRWNAITMYNLDIGQMQARVDGFFFTGRDIAKVNKYNEAMQLMVEYYRRLFLTNPYRNTPFKPKMTLNQIAEIFFPNEDKSQILKVYPQLMANNQLEQLKKNWFGIAVYEYFRKEVALTTSTPSIIYGLSLTQIVTLLNSDLNPRIITAMTNNYIIFATATRLIGNLGPQVLNVNNQPEWTSILGKENLYPLKYGMAVWCDDADCLETYARTFAILEMLDLPIELLIGI